MNTMIVMELKYECVLQATTGTRIREVPKVSKMCAVGGGTLRMESWSTGRARVDLRTIRGQPVSEVLVKQQLFGHVLL